VLVHIVLARFPREGDAEEAARLLGGLPAKVDVIRSLVAGPDVVRSDRSYDLGWIVELDSPDDLDTYSNHPAHLEVAQWITEHRTDIAVCDFIREG
jgi:hypothetical protein